MREIYKTIAIPIDGKEAQFRLKKLDAFSGAGLLRMLARLPEAEEGKDSLTVLFSRIPDLEFNGLMQHAEVLLPAGYMPVITQGEWSYPELQYDTAVCLKLTMEEALWTLEGFFGEGASICRSGTPGS